ncbi:5949_t:CDS:2, partial [Racocetra persica]
ITTNTEKQFCPSCGSATLIRTSASTDMNGKVTYYLKKNFQYNLRGTKYSIPNPKGGRHANNLILREDQKEYQNALKSHRKQKEVDIFDPDYVPKLFIGSGFSTSCGVPVIGYGRRNPNETIRGKGKGKKRR